MVLINTMFTLCHCVTKRGSIFWFFRPGMCFQTGQVFLSHNGQWGSLLVFYIGYILDKTKTLYVMVAFQFRIFMYSDNDQIKDNN
jgi:hypothetical protein